MEFFFIAFLTAMLGVSPLLMSVFFHGDSGSGYGSHSDDDNRTQKLIASAIVFAVAMAIFWLIFYLDPPALYKPWWGSVGLAVQIVMVVSVILAGIIEDSFPYVAYMPIVLFVSFSLSAFIRGSEIMNASEYSKLLGSTEKRVWTQDVQPKHPGHIRTNASANALYMARQALGQAGAIGSQFQIDENHITLQKVGEQFQFIIPLDHVGWSTWRHTKKVPAYIRVSGEDPYLPAELVKFPEGQELIYTPASCWEFNMERHLWANGYSDVGLMDYTPEVDDNGKYWFVVTTFDYMVNGWDGKKVTGVLLVDPTNGQITRQKLGSISKWADRVIPEDVVQQNLGYKGMYPEGDYGNTVTFFGWGARKNLTKPEESNMVFGADGELYWVTGMTSVRDTDSSLVSLYYTNTHTGKTVQYEAQGATDSTILSAINKHQDVQYRHLKGVAPQIYNIVGVMTAIIPMMNENFAYQGVGFVNVKNTQVMAFGANQLEAYEKYQAALSQSGHQIAPELERTKEHQEGVVDRFFAETQNGNLLFYLHLQNVPHIFTGTSQLSSKLRMTHTGDRVALGYVATGAEVEPLREFDNISLPLSRTIAQKQVREQGKANVDQTENRDEAGTIREKIKNLPDAELVKKFQK